MRSVQERHRYALIETYLRPLDLDGYIQMFKPIDIVAGNFHDTMGVVKHRPDYRWWYMSEQRPDEVVLFKGYDSDCSHGTRKGTGCKFNPSPTRPNSSPARTLTSNVPTFPTSTRLL